MTRREARRVYDATEKAIVAKYESIVNPSRDEHNRVRDHAQETYSEDSDTFRAIVAASWARHCAVRDLALAEYTDRFKAALAQYYASTLGTPIPSTPIASET
jgi:hypothetical protein